MALLSSHLRYLDQKVLADQRRRKLRQVTTLNPPDRVCTICGHFDKALDSRGKSRTLAQDHDHANHRLRGLLCHRCNMGLGLFFDNPEFLKAGAEYVREWRVRHRRNK